MERLAQRRQRLFATLPIHDHRDPHLARVNHADVDAALRQRAEHAAGDAGMRPHADSQHDQPGDVRLAGYLDGGIDASRQLARKLQGPGDIFARHTERDLRRPGPERFCTIMSTTMPAAATV